MGARFHSVVDPKVGSGRLYFFRDERDEEPTVTFSFSGGHPWHLSGRRPFHWDFLEPAGERDYGVIMLALSRNIRMEEKDRNLPPFPTPGTALIIVQIYRLQSDDLLPAAGEKINFQQIAGQPFRWYRNTDPFADPAVPLTIAPAADFCTIQPFPRGTDFTHDKGEWHFGISVPLAEPAAFVYDVRAPQPLGGYTILVVRTKAASLNGGRVLRGNAPTEEGNPIFGPIVRRPGPPLPPPVRVFEHTTHLSAVPPQGSVLDPNGFPFKEWEDFEEWLAPEAKKAVIIIETIIGFVPYVGAIYFAAQLAFAASTGKSFWGETMHEADYIVLGVIAVLPVAFNAGRIAPVLRSLSKSNRLFKAALAETTTLNIAERIDADLLETLKQVPLKQQDEILEAADGLAKGTVTGKQLLAKFDDIVRPAFEETLEKFEVRQTFERYADHIVEDPTFKEAVRGLGAKEAEFYDVYRAYKAGASEARNVINFFDNNMAAAVGRFKDEQRLLTVFTEDFAGFRYDPLRSRYAAYLKEGKTLSPVQWAKAQSGGQYRKALEAALGKDYTKLINKTLGERFIYDVTEAQKEAFKNILANPKLQTYVEIRGAAEKASIGRLFEVDHILEKRFLKSIRVGGEVPDEADFFAILVPKNPAVARQVTDLTGIYTHSVKTQMLRDLIPHGAEDLYTLQQWWDAHVFVLKQLGADPAVYMKKFADTFSDVAASTRQPFLARFSQTEELFAPAQWRPRPRAPVTVPAAAGQ